MYLVGVKRVHCYLRIYTGFILTQHYNYKRIYKKNSRQNTYNLTFYMCHALIEKNKIIITTRKLIQLLQIQNINWGFCFINGDTFDKVALIPKN